MNAASSGGFRWGEQVEGRQAVRELLRAGRRPTRNVTIAEASGPAGALGEIAELARHAGVPVRRVERGALFALAATDAPQGVVARAAPLPPAELGDLVATTREKPFLVVLDGVTDPHNLGALLRSALAAGSTGLVLGRHRAAGLTPAAMKAAAGAAEHVRVAAVAGIPAALQSLGQAGVWTVALDPEARVSLWDLPVATEAVAVVLGAEGHGLSRLTRQRCEVAVRIPMRGPVASLNVSAAGALACFEIARRRSGLGNTAAD